MASIFITKAVCIFHTSFHETHTSFKVDVAAWELSVCRDRKTLLLEWLR